MTTSKKIDDLKKFKVFGIGVVPLMITIFVLTMIVVTAYEILFF